MARSKNLDRPVRPRIDVTLREVYEALAKVGMKETIKNVKDLCDYLETAARDAARDAFIDWQEQQSLHHVAIPQSEHPDTIDENAFTREQYEQGYF